MKERVCYVCKQTKDIKKFGGCVLKNGKTKYSGRCSTCMHKSKRSKVHNRVYFSLKHRLRMDFRKLGYVKSRNFDIIFGIRPLEFKKYLEGLFVDDMSWDNYGKWEIDHIIPLSYSNNQVEYELYSSYKNVRPLWSNDNRSKGSKLTEDSNRLLNEEFKK
jgi:hypothetical protein